MNANTLRAIGVYAIAFIVSLLIVRSCSGLSFIDALAYVESGYDYNAVGDGGKALGAWQLHRTAWEDVRRKHPVVGQHRINAIGTRNARTQRFAAETYLAILRQRFASAGIENPCYRQLHAAWNMGFRGFRSIGFDASRAPTTTLRAQQRLIRYLSKQ